MYTTRRLNNGTLINNSLTYLDDVGFGGEGKLGDKSFFRRHFYVDAMPVGVHLFIVNEKEENGMILLEV